MKTRHPFLLIFALVVFTLNNNLFAQEVYEMTVAPDGSGDYTSIQKAIDNCKSFPDKRITIFVKNGIYREKIVVASCNPQISLIGEDPEKTIITWGDYFDKMNRGRNSTFYTYTMLVIADDFIAENITIENSAGPVGQAIALFVRGDRCVFRNCRITGNQDTLYTDGSNVRHYFENCYIDGTTDFIFGSSTALFKNCVIHSKKNSYITAASTPQGNSFGYVFVDCKLTADDEVDKVFLGRPWRDYAKVVFIRCEMGNHISPEGWSNWSGTERDKTAFYAEYGNTGPGSETSQRVAWSHQLTRKQGKQYTVENILKPRTPVDPAIEQWIKGGK
jgi:pectinesterase